MNSYLILFNETLTVNWGEGAEVLAGALDEASGVVKAGNGRRG